MTRNELDAGRFMSVPGMRPITALCYFATIDDPTRFNKSRNVAPTWDQTCW